MKGYIIRKALKYLRGQMDDIREFWETASRLGLVDLTDIESIVECVYQSVKFVLKHGKPHPADVEKALGK